MSTIHPEMYKRPAECALKIISGPGTGDMFPIFINESLIIGKGEECTVRLDTLSEKISYKHARLTPRGNDYLLENLSSANPTTVDNQPIGEKYLSKGGRFQIDEVIFYLTPPVFDQKRHEVPSEKKTSGRHRMILLIGLLAVSLLFVSILLFKGKKPDERVSDETGKTAPVKPDDGDHSKALNILPATNSRRFSGSESIDEKPVIPSGAGRPSTGNRSSDQGGMLADKNASEEKFRKGMFFYDNNQLKNAILSWQTALALNPDHHRAATWMERAKGELDQKINDHYRNGLKAKKYMRIKEAANEFRTVLELCLDNRDERYLGSQEQLNSLSGK